MEGNGSMFSKSQLWSSEQIETLRRAFVDNPLPGPERFLEKFATQLSSLGSETKQLAAEFLWLLLLFPLKITGERKRLNVMEVWSWSGEVLDERHPLLTFLDNGVGSTGQAYNTYRNLELAFAIKTLLAWRGLPEHSKHPPS